MTDIAESTDRAVPRQKRSYVPKATARGLLIDATIELLREHEFSKVTTRRIAERSKLNLAAIQSTFGSQQGLLIAVVAELGDRVAATLRATPNTVTTIDPAILGDPDALLRIRLVA